MSGKTKLAKVIVTGLSFTTLHANAQTVGGDAVQYQTLTIEWAGTSLDEFTSVTNPFLDRRLDVEFTNGSTTLIVPGYYAVDNATGVNDTWRVNFTAPEAGEWTFTPRYYAGSNVAVTAADSLGSPNASLINGQGATVNIAAFDPNAPGFLSKGTLGYTGKHYLQFANGEYYLKTGADSPENFLGYEGFDNTTKNSVPPARGILHTYGTHVADWQPGDPDWDNDDADAIANDGRGIIGALNYLHNLGDTSYAGSAKVNSIYFLPMNIGGDGQDTHPFASTSIDLAGNGTNNNVRYDLSKLDQWEQVFSHAQEKGIMLHFVLNEAENPNKLELDNATLGTERKLFYREMIARFGHHQGVVWNVSEEYNLGTAFGANDAAEAATAESFADWIKAIDPYAHPVTVHNAKNPNPAGGPTAGTWQYFIGDESWDATSLQLINNFQTLGDAVEAFRAATFDAGRPIPIMIDEPESVEDITFEQVRKEMIWDILLSGGNVEWYTRSQDQSLDNFRQLETVWQQTFYARKFLQENTRFWEMQPSDELLVGEDVDFGGGEVFAIIGEQYALYLPDGSNDDNNGGPPTLDLTGQNDKAFGLRWYNPQTGVFVGGTTVLRGGNAVSLGFTPDGFQSTNDWAALVTRLLDGDLNFDNKVSFSDFNTLSNNYNGPTTGQTWSTGDFNGDGDVTFADFIILSNNYGIDANAAAASAQADSASAVAPGEAKLIVGLDGSLTIEAGNVDLNGYSITSASGQLITDGDNNASPFTFYIANSATDITAGNLGTFVNIDGLLELDATVNLADLSNLDLIFEYGTAAGSVTGTVEVVPEPSTLALLGFGGLLLARRRRR